MERLTRAEYISDPPSIKQANLPSYTGVYEKLAEYEDTGLIPEEINHLKERQIKKPIIPMNFGEYYICPNCKVTIHYGRIKPLKYCEDCGQAIAGPEEHCGKLKP